LIDDCYDGCSYTLTRAFIQRAPLFHDFLLNKTTRRGEVRPLLGGVYQYVQADLGLDASIDMIEALIEREIGARDDDEIQIRSFLDASGGERAEDNDALRSHPGGDDRHEAL